MIPWKIEVNEDASLFMGLLNGLTVMPVMICMNVRKKTFLDGWNVRSYFRLGKERLIIKQLRARNSLNHKESQTMSSSAQSEWVREEQDSDTLMRLFIGKWGLFYHVRNEGLLRNRSCKILEMKLGCRGLLIGRYGIRAKILPKEQTDRALFTLSFSLTDCLFLFNCLMYILDLRPLAFPLTFTLIIDSNKIKKTIRVR
jgi:hypothetical protein